MTFKFGKIYSLVSTSGYEVEGILIDFTKSGPEYLAHMIYNSITNGQLSFNYIYVSVEDVSKIKLIDKSLKVYFDKIFNFEFDEKYIDILRDYK